MVQLNSKRILREFTLIKLSLLIRAIWIWSNNSVKKMTSNIRYLEISHINILEGVYWEHLGLILFLKLPYLAYLYLHLHQYFLLQSQQLLQHTCLLLREEAIQQELESEEQLLNNKNNQKKELTIYDAVFFELFLREF